MPVLFGQARVVVTPYVRASQSGVAHLAYTFGRPVVATAVGDIPDVVRQEETGLLAEPGDVEQLAAGMVRLFKDPETAQQFGEAGLRRMNEESSWEVVATRVRDTVLAVERSRDEHQGSVQDSRGDHDVS